MRRLGVKHLRTGLSWADSLRPQALTWFDRQMKALDEFAVTLTYCFTPESQGIRPHHTSAPRCPEAFAQFWRAQDPAVRSRMRSRSTFSSKCFLDRRSLLRPQ